MMAWVPPSESIIVHQVKNHNHIKYGDACLMICSYDFLLSFEL